MKTKICNKCGIEKPLSEFYFRKDCNNYRKWCKTCEKLRTSKYYYDNQDVERAKQNERAKLHRKEKRKYDKERYKEIGWKKRKYNLEHREERKLRDKKNIEHIRKRKNSWRNKRKETDYLYVLKENTRNLIKDSFKRKHHYKSSKTKDILGISLDEFSQYLLKTFKDRYGYDYIGQEPVHIDHIIPLDTALNEQDVIKLCHYTNLQLLKAKDNLEKSNRLDWI